MSASREKKLRKDPEDGVFAPTAKSGGKKDNRNSIIFIVVAIVIVVVFLVLVFFNSGILNKYVKAADVGGHKVTTSELSFYYNYQYNNFLTNYSDYLDYIGLDTSKDLDKQESTFSEGQTWHEYFLDQAISSASEVYLLCDEAQAAGFALSEDDLTGIDGTIEYFKSSAASSGYTVGSYLRAVYGKGVSEKLFREILARQYTAESYQAQMMSQFADAVTDEEIDAYYADNSANYLNISYRAFLVSSGIDTEADDEAAQAEKLADAEAVAKEMAESIVTEKDFADQAYANASEETKANYEDEDYTLITNTRYYMTTSVEGDDYAWLADESRQAGDVTYVQVGSDYRVLMYLDESLNTAPGSADVIAIVSTVEADAADTSAAKAEIDAVAELYNADSTEENFRSLVSMSDEQTNADGVYTNVSAGSFGVTEIDDWLFAEGRAAGDTQIIETADAFYYLYVTDVVEYWRASIASTLTNTAYNEWYTGKSESYIIAENALGINLLK